MSLPLCKCGHGVLDHNAAHLPRPRACNCKGCGCSGFEAAGSTAQPATPQPSPDAAERRKYQLLQAAAVILGGERARTDQTNCIPYGNPGNVAGAVEEAEALLAEIERRAAMVAPAQEASR